MGNVANAVLTLILSPPAKRERGRRDQIRSPLPCRVRGAESARRRCRLRQRVRARVFPLIATLLVALAGCTKSDHTAVQYHCPMHPEVVSDQPAKCDKCGGMDLVPKPANDKPAPTKPAGKAAKFHCPMHPTVVSDKAGDCPICSMKLVPIGAKLAEHAAHEASTVPGLATVSIAPAARERMGVTFGTVEKRKLAKEIRTSARIVTDEAKLYHVTLKVEGWVDHLHSITTGKFIQKGEPLLTIYSPMLLSAQEELLSALRSGSDSLVAAARRRLQLWDVPAEQIARLEKTGQVEKSLTLHAPLSGWIIERNIAAGHKVMPGEPLLVMADLSVLWAEADVYESDLPYAKLDMPVELTFPYWPGKIFAGKVIFLSPTLDPATRTLKARMEIPNPEALLKPEMYATARLSYDLGEKPAIPEAAVMRAADHTYAFKESGDHQLVPVKIVIGLRSDGWFEVLDGLKEGDRVVTSANFLVDSESSMKAALAGMGTGHAH